MTVKAFIMDVDGTLTDGAIYMSPAGEALKVFNVKDGLSIARMAKSESVVPIVITGRSSLATAARLNELGVVEVHQGVSDKLKVMRDVLKTHGIGLDEAAYIGDDVNDLECMEAIVAAGGIVGCPHDGVDAVRDIADVVTSKDGGKGAVREFADKVLNL